MNRPRFTVLRFEIRKWDRERLLDFVTWHINRPLTHCNLSLTVEEVLEGVIAFILDFEYMGDYNPTLVMDNLEDYIETRLNGLGDGEHEVDVDQITFNRLRTAFNDLAELISEEIEYNVARADIEWPRANIDEIQVRRNCFIITFENPDRLSLW